MSTAGLPDWVVKQCERKGIRATQRGIAEAAGTYAPTVKRVLDGRGDPDSIKAVALALGVPLGEFAQRVGYSNELGPWDPPSEAHRLSAPEREALGVIIRAMVQGGQQTSIATDGSEEDESTTPAGGNVVEGNFPSGNPQLEDDAAITGGRGKSAGQIQQELADQAGQENQDTGNDDDYA